MASYKKITTVSEISQLRDGTTFFVNDAGALRQAKLSLLTGGTGAASLAADGVSVIIENGIVKAFGFDAAAVGAQPRKAADGTIEWVVPATSDALQSSDEVLIEDGSLSIGEINILKIIQDADTELIFDAGTSV